ncbi:MAG: DsbA family protein [Candidatus Nomurabacteria bacterium]|jgi:protein-disulfide isomerase|nr:DsbA family protein [Candidatus Nomurabacteria bacterium]
MNENVKKILKYVGIGLGLAAIVLLFVLLARKEDKYAKLDPRDIQVPSAVNGQIGDHVLGGEDTGVVLLEYGDFQCQGCASADPRIQALVKEYGDKITFIFRNFPLTSIHQNTKAAASAVEAAGLQGKYWEMHVKIYENQEAWFYSGVAKRTEQFQSYARELELDMTQFDKDFASSEVTAKINSDLNLGQKDDVSGTPSFFLNGRALDSKEWGTDVALRKALDAVINAGSSEDEDTGNTENKE